MKAAKVATPKVNALIVRGLRAVVSQKTVDGAVCVFNGTVLAVIHVWRGVHFNGTALALVRITSLKDWMELAAWTATFGLAAVRIYFALRNKGKGDSSE